MSMVTLWPDHSVVAGNSVAAGSVVPEDSVAGKGGKVTGKRGKGNNAQL